MHFPELLDREPLCSANISSARNYESFPLAGLTSFSGTVVGEERTVVVRNNSVSLTQAIKNIGVSRL